MSHLSLSPQLPIPEAVNLGDIRNIDGEILKQHLANGSLPAASRAKTYMGYPIGWAESPRLNSIIPAIAERILRRLRVADAIRILARRE